MNNKEQTIYTMEQSASKVEAFIKQITDLINNSKN